MALYPFTNSGLSDLTAAGVSSSIRVEASAVTFAITVSGIGTNVVVRLEGSLDDVNYFNLDQNDLDYTITSNGTYGYALNGCPVEYVRVRLVSFVGGTPTVASRVGAS